MSQHDYVLDNQNGVSFRADLNSAMAAIVTNNMGATAPTITFAGMWWADTSSGWLKQRNATDTAWVSRFNLTTDLTVNKTSDTGSLKQPAGTTAERDSTPSVGWSRFNTTTGRQEVWNGINWVSSGGAVGGGSDDAFYENTKTITTNYTITTGKNAMSAGPIEVTDDITVTIPDGSTWSIV